MRGFYRNTHSLPIQIALVQKTSLAKISLAKISFDIETHPSNPRLLVPSLRKTEGRTSFVNKVKVKVYFTIIHHHYNVNTMIITTYGKGTEALKLI